MSAAEPQEACRKRVPAVSELLRRRRFQKWRHYEDLGAGGDTNSQASRKVPWRVQTQKDLAELCEPYEQPEMDIDPLVAKTRVLTEHEMVDAMINKRVEAESFKLPKEAAPKRCAEAPVKRKKRSRTAVDEDIDNVAQDITAQAVVQAIAEAETQAQRNLDEVAPMLSIAAVREQRLARAQMQSARLVAGSYEDATLAFLKVQHMRPLITLTTSLDGSAHANALDRIASRITGRLRSKRVLRSECQKLDLQGITDDLPRIDPNDVIVIVAVCNAKGVKEQEFEMLASQPLTKLRDAFWFVQDFMFDGPRRMKSACFFIDGVFYVDRRHQAALDYSTELIEWLKATRPDKLRATESRSMDTPIGDLDRVPFGECCIYLHQGDIEHNVFFTGARLVSPADCPLLEAYPLLTFMRKYQKQRCVGCMQKFASWMVLDSSRTPHNPCFFCASCFCHFFQDEAGEFLPPVDYKVFPYLHDE